MRELRQSKNISQMDLSQQLGVSRQTLSKWENDSVLPDALNIISLAEFFDVSTDYLLRGVNSCQDPMADSSFRIKKQILDWIGKQDNWLYIFIAIYMLFLLIVWVLIYEPTPKSFPIG